MSILDELTSAAAVTTPEGAVKKITRKADSAVIWEKPSKTFTFYFSMGSYQAEPGMTWSQWKDSPYNVDGLALAAGTNLRLTCKIGSTTYYVYDEGTKKASYISDIVREPGYTLSKNASAPGYTT